MAVFKLSPDAKKELQTAVKWYNKKKIDLGKSFYIQVKSTYKYIQQYPEGFEIKYNGFRGTTVEGFPFILFYDIQPNYIVIVAVFHTSKDLSKLDKRIKDL
jgi:plasmid stabilization system protein ParE